ncbi:MAG TPA: helix-turn-helix domain-containing protein [Nocardioides sp.]|nr:helix-turn-helix domain-containing protein [Nocardioides sp.]
MTVSQHPAHEAAPGRADDPGWRLALELRLSGVAAADGGIASLVQAIALHTNNPVWLIDPRGRVVSRSQQARGSDFRPPRVDLLLAHHGPADLVGGTPLMVSARPAKGLERRHLLMPVRRGDCLFAWLVVAEVSAPLGPKDSFLASRGAFHIAAEYAVQRRVARASWNARGAFARQLLRGQTAEADLADAAEYLGVQADADRVLVYVGDADGADIPDTDEDLAGRAAAHLRSEVLATRGREGIVLLVEVPEAEPTTGFVRRVKRAMQALVVEAGLQGVAIGVSGVTRPAALPRAYRETREVVLCVDRFARTSDRVIAVDDLGPARLFVANGDLTAVRRYVRDILGALLDGAPGTVDLLRTLQCFFDTGRSVRESAARLGIHENTVRLRMAKIHDLTGLDVASCANDQLSAQTALLVLRLDGHPAVPGFDDGPARVADRDADSA